MIIISLTIKFETNIKIKSSRTKSVRTIQKYRKTSSNKKDKQKHKSL